MPAKPVVILHASVREGGLASSDPDQPKVMARSWNLAEGINDPSQYLLLFVSPAPRNT